MSKLRLSLLETIRIIGNASGCHQMPERSFFYKGKQFPVCARCTGVAIGQFVAVIVAVFNKSICIADSMLLLSVMGIDWCLQAVKIKESTNIRRLITGFCGGFGLFSIYIHIIKYVIHKIK